jgi:hypothetical protein
MQSFMKSAGVLVWTIQIAPRKPEWFQTTNDDCQQGIGTFPEKKRKLLQGSRNGSAQPTKQK